MAGTTSSGTTAQGTLANANDAVTIGTLNVGVVGFQLTGTWTGVVTFEATIDGVNWVAVNADPVPTGAAATTTTANGLYQVPCAGFSQVRARFSTATSGIATCTTNACLSPRST